MIIKRLAVFSIRHAKPVILFWLCFTVLLGCFAVRLPSVLKGPGLDTDGSYTKVQRILAADYHLPDDPIILLFEKRNDVSQEKFHSLIAASLMSVQAVPGLLETISPLQIPGMENENAAYAFLTFQQKDQQLGPVLSKLKQLLPKDQRVTIRLTGKSVVQEDVNKISRSSLKKAELIGLPVAFLVLWLSFGGVVPAMIPIAVGLTAVTGAMGMLAVLGSRIPLSVFILSVIPMVGLAVSIDFALVLVSRFREEAGHIRQEYRIVIAVQTAGRAVIFSAWCVGLGLVAITFLQMPIFTTVALGATVVLALSVCVTLTLVPALLTVFGHRIKGKRTVQAGSGSLGLWRRGALFVMKKPVGVLVAALLLLSFCISPLARMQLVIPDAGSLPKGTQSRLAAEIFEKQFISPARSRVYAVVSGSFPPDQSRLTDSLTRQLRQDPRVIQVVLVNSTPDRQLLSITIRGNPSSKDVRDWVRKWERQTGGSGLPILWGGEPKYEQEVFDGIFGRLPHVLLCILLSNYIVLFFAFRSFLIPIKTILMNFLSIAASFGILVWVFGDGHFGIEPAGIAIMIPVFIFGLTFGISMDFGVFLLSRMAELHERTGNNEQSVTEGLALTSGIITSAAAIMIAVTVPFLGGGVTGVKQLGLGIAAAVFIDATLIRLMLTPALMRLLGKWNWYPSWGKTNTGF